MNRTGKYSETLRAIGSILDLRGDDLIRLLRPRCAGTIGYLIACFRTEQGEIEEERHSFRDLYDLNVRMYKQRNIASGRVMKRSSSSRHPWPAREQTTGSRKHDAKPTRLSQEHLDFRHCGEIGCRFSIG